MNLNSLLEGMVKVSASDLHLKVNSPPILRINTNLRNIDHPILTVEEILQVLDVLLPSRLREDFETEGAVDFAHSIPGVGRYRIAAFHQQGAISIAIRRVSLIIPSLKELHLPIRVYPLVDETRGLILVTGVTGSGKSTTLASMLNEINNTRRDHIVTLEDPIEYLFQENKCLINQVEIGVDCESFRGAMKRVVRFDPDIIMVGEMRSRETVGAAIEAADTGHMVLSTLHTSDAKQTINRILHFFPKEDEDLILEQLAQNLKAIISQRLLPRSDKPGLVPAVELLINVPIVSKLIRKGQIDDIQQALKNQESGMQSFDVSMALLVREEMISMDTAMKYCADVAGLKRMVRGEFSAGDKGGLIGGGF